MFLLRWVWHEDGRVKSGLSDTGSAPLNAPEWAIPERYAPLGYIMKANGNGESYDSIFARLAVTLALGWNAIQRKGRESLSESANLREY